MSAAGTARSNGEARPDPEPVGEPAYEPPWLSAGTAVVASLSATLLLASALLAALGPAGVGAAVAVLGVVAGRRRVVSLGVALLFSGLLLAGIEGGRPTPLLLSALLIAVAYDAAHYAVTLGEQLRAGAATTRAELVHVGATATVASAVAGTGALTFRIGTGGQPSTALITLLLATVFLVWALLR